MRDQIVELARRRLQERGAFGLTMGQLAEELRISKKTLYCYFSSKGDLIGAVIDGELAALDSRLYEALRSKSPPSRESIGGVVRPLRRAYSSVSETTLQELRTHYPRQWARIVGWWQEEARPRLLLLARRAIDAGLIQLPVSPEELVAFLAITLAWTSHEDALCAGTQETRRVFALVLSRGLFGEDTAQCACLAE